MAARDPAAQVLLLQLQRTAGNQSVMRLARSGCLDRLDLKASPAPPGPDRADAAAANPAPASAAPRGPSPAVPAEVSAAQPAAPAGAAAAESANPASDTTAAPASIAASVTSAASSGVPGTLTWTLTRLQTARPSTFCAEAAAATKAGQAEWAAQREAGTLESAPVPTGLATGEPVTPAETPEIPLPELNGPTRSSAGAAATVLEPTGDVDPAHADEWSRAGTAALDATATPPVPAPVAPRLRSPASGDLPKTAAPPVSALTPPGALPAADADALTTLDLNMGPKLPGEVSRFLAPALAADQLHATEVAAVKEEAGAGRGRIDSETRHKQTDAGTAADRQVQDLHRGWVSQRATLVGEHKTWMREQSASSRGEAQQTIADANSQAKARVDEAEKSQPEGEHRSSGWWDKIKAAGRAVVGAIRDVAGSVVSVVAGILDTARRKIHDILDRLGRAIRQRIDAAVQAIAQAAKRAWAAMAAAIEKAQDFVKRLAAAAAALARKLWADLKARLAAAWDRLSRAVKAAFDAARALASKIASALATLREILKILRSGALEKLFEATKDPAKLARPIVDKAAPLVDLVPPKADQLTREKGLEVPPPAATRDRGSGTMRVQRSPAPQQSVGDQAADLILQGRIKEGEPEIPAPAPGEGFWSGVWRHLKAAGNHFLQNWKTTLINIVWSLLTFYPVLLQEGPKLWGECKGVIFGGGGVDRFDHVLGVLRHLVNMVAGLVATAGIWALIIGAFTGPGEAIVVGAYETISLGVIAADVALGLVEMGKAWYSATREGISSKTRETYLGMFSGSVISTAITIVLVVLGAIASRLAKAFKARRAAAAGESAEGAKPKSEAGSGDRKGAGQPEVRPDEPLSTEAKVGDPAHSEAIRTGTVRGELHPDFPKLKAEAEGFGFKLERSDKAQAWIMEVVDESGNIIRTEKKLYYIDGMRYIDFEHELGHIRQMMERFQGKPPPLERMVQKADGTLRKAQGSELHGILTVDQNAVAELHNRLQEYVRLKERGAGPDLLREHETGVQAWYRKARSAGLISEKSSLTKWAQEHFPDLADLERKYVGEGGKLR